MSSHGSRVVLRIVRGRCVLDRIVVVVRGFHGHVRGWGDLMRLGVSRTGRVAVARSSRVIRCRLVFGGLTMSGLRHSRPELVVRLSGWL